MAIELKFVQALYVGDDLLIGSDTSKQSITLSSGQSYVIQDKTIADNYGEDILWASGDGGLDNYTHGFIYSDQDLIVELKTDNGTPEYVLLEVKANVIASLPAIAGGNTTESIDGAVLVDGTDYDDVVQIRIQRDVADAVGDATVSLFLFA